MGSSGRHRGRSVALAATVCALAWASGCTEGTPAAAGHTAAAAARSAEPSKAAVPARLLSQRELKAAALRESSPIDARPFAIRAGSADPADCTPVLAAAQGQSQRMPRGMVHGQVGAGDQVAAEVFLTAYSAEDAGRVMDDLRAALRTCRAFPTLNGGGKWSDVRAAEQLGSGEDELAFRAKLVPVPDTPALATEVRVVRVGATLVTFATNDMSGTRDEVSTPKDLVHRQVAALQKVLAASAT